MKKYGVIIGRFQPFHIGHQHLIDKIRSDGLEPVIIKGSAQEFSTEKNPYHPLQVIEMLHLVNPGIKVLCLDDVNNWDAWYNNLKEALELALENLSQVTIYLHDKLEDLQDFTFRGEDYFEESYSKMYTIDGMHTTKLSISDIQIRAKSIREDLESNKQFLHPKVYEYITKVDKNILVKDMLKVNGWDVEVLSIANN